MSLELITALIPEDWYDFDDILRAQVPPIKNLTEGIRMLGSTVPYAAMGTAFFVTSTAIALKMMFGGWSKAEPAEKRDVDDEGRDKLS